MHGSDNVLITGASGFIGSAVARLLVERGFAVRALIRPTSTTFHLSGLALEFVTGDCAANPRARGIFTGDPVARFAAETDPADFSAYFQREKELRGGLRNAARYRAGRII